MVFTIDQISDGGSESKPKCSVCGTKNKTLKRCSRCRMVQYCGVSCQREDWSRAGGHRRTCASAILDFQDGAATGASREAASQAWGELSQILASSSIEEASADQQKALHHLESIKQEEDTRKRTEKLRSMRTVEEPKKIQSETSVVPVQPQESDTVAFSPTAENLSDFREMWVIFLEALPHLMCYQIRIRLKNGNIMDPNKVDLRLQPSLDKEDTFRVGLKMRDSDDDGNSETTSCESLHMVLKGTTHQREPTSAFSSSYAPRIHSLLDGSCSIRLPVSTPIEPKDLFRFAPRLLSLEDTNKLACRHCHQLIFDDNKRSSFSSNNKQAETSTNGDTTSTRRAEEDGTSAPTIGRVVALPVGHWDELSDYLICYPGQPFVDFGPATMAAQTGCMLQNDTVCVVHADDVGTSLTVLAVTGYGQDENNDYREENDDPVDATDRNVSSSGVEKGDDSATVRGTRLWSDAFSGASLSCSLCGAIVGTASIHQPDTYRLLQHQLCIHHSAGSRLTRPVKTVLDFVVNELIRHAEAKAIFAMSVQAEGIALSQSLYLKLLSWDGATASSVNEVPWETEKSTNTYVPEWRRTAKVLYEVVSTSVASKKTAPSVWSWANDPCCAPIPQKSTAGQEDKKAVDSATTGTTESNVSIVDLCLSRTEWEELHVHLTKYSHFYPSEVVEATALARIGRGKGAVSGIRMAAIPVR